MTIYAKLISGNEIEKAPNNKGSIINFGKNENLMKKDGYKKVIQVEIPETDRQYEITYSEDDDYIYENISYLETEEEFQERISTGVKNAKIKELQEEINNIDLKRIRAICEPSVKDELTGETWLDYYNAQIISLRANIAELEEENDENQ
ncbi:MAG: hypothetical protein LUH05_00405 [Candidatus Gastranaerophilales bacterium]|nr:hypothetical protein [Candidatus Gastranaerophilales bacterium]